MVFSPLLGTLDLVEAFWLIARVSSITKMLSTGCATQGGTWISWIALRRRCFVTTLACSRNLLHFLPLANRNLLSSALLCSPPFVVLFFSLSYAYASPSCVAVSKQMYDYQV